jgi:hypothetical protein
MRHKLQIAAWALGVWAMLAAPAFASHEPAPADTVAKFARAHLANDSVIALLLLLVSEQEAKVHAQLQALYDAGYISTAPSGSDPSGRYLSGALAARYKPKVSGDVVLAMLDLQRFLTKELRAGGVSRPARLRAGIVRAGSRLSKGQEDEFAENVADWLAFLQRAVKGLKAPEIAMLRLQNSASARSQAIALTANMLAVVDAASKQIIANIGAGEQSSGPAGSTIESGDSGSGTSSGSGGECSIGSDTGCSP